MNSEIKNIIQPNTLTFAIIKPDAVARGIQYDMMKYIVEQGFKIRIAEQRFMTKEETEWLYREHVGKDFFEGQVNFMLSNEVVLMVLECPQNAAIRFRELMGPTDYTKADPYTLRARYALGYRENSIHGSDSPQSASEEIEKFFSLERFLEKME